MYKATLSFTTNTYDVRKNEILADDFTTQDEIQEYLAIGYIVEYDPTLEITENGMYDVKNYQNADVDVAGGQAVLQEKSVSYSNNTTTTVQADEGYDGLSEVNITVDVPQPSGIIDISDNGYHNVKDYEVASVWVQPPPPVPDWSQVYFAPEPDFVQKAYNTASDILTNIDSYIADNSYTCNYLFVGQDDLLLFPDTYNSQSMPTVNQFNGMFQGCTNLVDVGFIDMTNATDALQMFENCPNLGDLAFNSILNALIGATNLTVKQLAYIGFDSTQINNIVNNYSDIWDYMQSEGWTTGL